MSSVHELSCGISKGANEPVHLSSCHPEDLYGCSGTQVLEKPALYMLRR